MTATAPKISVDTKPHVVIRASAGSGKTFQLSNRYLDLLHHDFSPDSILATTFTRKAAGEILERILRRLAQASLDEVKAHELQQSLSSTKPITLARARDLLALLCRSLHRVSVSTIDSFFNRIASSFRFELGVPHDPHLVAADDPLAMMVRAQAIEAMLGDADIDVFLGLLKRLHHDEVSRSVTEVIDKIVVALYDTYRQTRREDWHRLPELPRMNGEQLAAAMAALDELAQNPPSKALAGGIKRNRESILAGDWKGFACRGIAKKLIADGPGACFNKQPIPPAVAKLISKFIAHSRGVLIGGLKDQTEATYDLLARFDGHYVRLRDQHRVLLYSDLPHKLARELPRREDLLLEICYRLDASVAHLLLDEFQDTSFEQWKVLEPFATEIASNSDGSRSFFCVGDLKQAIYGWRGGRAELFNHIVGRLSLSQEAQVELDVSYRSSKVVLEVVNDVFESLPTSAAWKPDKPDRAEAAVWADGFSAHVAQRELPGYVELITSTAEAKAGDDPHEMAGNGNGNEDEDCDDEADAGLVDEDREADGDDSGVADAKVSHEVAGDVVDAGHDGFVARTIARIHRDAPGRSVGVLVSTNATAQALIFKLRALGVEASAEGKAQIAGDPAVEVVLAALKLADHPGDTVAAFHVLNSPLALVVGITSMSESERQRVALAIRAAIFARGLAMVITDWATRLVAECEPRSARRLAQLVELADRFEPDMELRTSHFIQVVRTARIEEPSQAAVRVMTIHGSKGLEFDAVILPELHKVVGAVNAKLAVTIDRDSDTDEVLAVYRGTSAQVRALCPPVEEAYQQERMRRLRDDLCMLYVAMTRARHALHLIVPPLTKTKSGQGVKGLADQSFAALLRHALCESPGAEDDAGGQTLFSTGDQQWMNVKQTGVTAKPHAAPAKVAALAVAVAGRDAVSAASSPPTSSPSQGSAQPPSPSPSPPLSPGVRAGGQRSRRSWRLVAPSSLHQRGRVDLQDLLNVRQDQPRLRGTLMHAWCERVQWLDEPGGLPDDAALHAAATMVLADTPQPAEWIDRQIAEFRRMLAQPAVARALSKPVLKADETVDLWRERPFAVRREDDLMRGSFDRVVLTMRGRQAISVQLIDFKTDHVDANSLSDRIDQYRPQIAAYREALSMMLRLDARRIATSLLFLGMGVVHPCT